MANIMAGSYNHYYNKNSNTKSREEANELRKQLKRMLEICPVTLGPSDKSYFDYMANKAGVAGLKRAISKLKKIGDAPQRKHCIMVVAGNTYNYRDKLKHYQFRITKEQGQWLHYKEISEDKAEFWFKAINEIDSSLCVFKTDNISKVIEPLLVAQEIEKEERKLAQDKRDKTHVPHEIDGVVFETTKWYGKIIKEELGLDFIFRNVKVKRVYRETDKAYQVDFELFGGVASCCGVCGRSLDNQISITAGIGPICATRMGLPRPTEKTAKKVLGMLKEKAKSLGVVEKKWIPKSQITRVEVKNAI